MPLLLAVSRSYLGDGGRFVDEWKLQPARDLQQSGLARYRNPLREHGLVSSVLRLGWWSGVRLLLVHEEPKVPAIGDPARYSLPILPKIRDRQ